MTKLREPVTAGSSAVGAVNMLAVVQSVDVPTLTAYVLNQLKGQIKISLTRLPGKGSMYPAVGETWMITQIFGDWMLVFPVNPEAATGPTSARPQHPQTGQRYFDTTLNLPIWYGNTSWVNATGATV